MKFKYLIIAICVTGLIFLLVFTQCSKPTYPEKPITADVHTGAATSITPDGALLNGSFANPSHTPEKVGFDWGETISLGKTIEGAMDGGSFSGSLTGLTEGRQYYFRAYIVIRGEKIPAENTASFLARDTSLPSDMPGWLELPLVEKGDNQIYKTYYDKLKDDKTDRNYSILFDQGRYAAMWVAFSMHKDLHLGSIPRDELDKWAYDTEGDIPQGVQPGVVNYSYANSDSDRGHQIASADRNGALDAGRRTYHVTNMTPQNSNLNQQIWAGLEEAIRNVAWNASVTQDTLYVITGPMFISPNPATTLDRATPAKACPIPDKYFKVVLWSKYDAATQTRTYDSIGFEFENKNHTAAYGHGKSDYPKYAKSVGYIEQATGLKMFAVLDGLEEAGTVAAIKNTSDWSSFTKRDTNPY